MAVLSVDTLSGCNSIPSFLGGLSDTPSNPSITVFHNTNAPVGWSKTTTHNDKALKVIGGANGSSISIGGTVGFTSVFSPKNQVTTSGISTSNISVTPNVGGQALNTDSSGSANLQSVTLSTVETPVHAHTYTSSNFPGTPSVVVGASPTAAAAQSTIDSGGAVQGSPSPLGHTHALSGPITSHIHPVSESPHTHPISNTGPHSHTVTLNQDFSILYVDVIIATKS